MSDSVTPASCCSLSVFSLQELDKIPLFMTKQPTQADIDASPDLQAMQALIQAESTPTCKTHQSQHALPSTVHESRVCGVRGAHA